MIAKGRIGSLLWLALLCVAAACTTEVTTFGSSGAGAGSSSGSGGTDFGACSASEDCILVEPGCCNSCGELTLDAVEPINQQYVSAFYDATCMDPNPECPECASLPNPNLIAYCNAGRCAEADISTEPWNQCNDSSDCRLRAGLDCCESCMADMSNLVAIHVDGEQALRDLVCDGGDVGCAACAPIYPANAFASCEAGVCTVLYGF